MIKNQRIQRKGARLRRLSRSISMTVRNTRAVPPVVVVGLQIASGALPADAEALHAKCAFFGECARVTAELLAEFAPIETEANHR